MVRAEVFGLTADIKSLSSKPEISGLPCNKGQRGNPDSSELCWDITSTVQVDQMAESLQPREEERLCCPLEEWTDEDAL